MKRLGEGPRYSDWTGMADVIVLVRVKLSLFRGRGKDRVRGSVNSRVQSETWESVT